MSIVPFVKDVNVGAANYDKNWVRWDLWEQVNGTCSRTRYTNKTDCQSNGKIWTPANHNTWNGCVTDRDQNYDTKNDAPVAGATLYPAEQYDSCPATSVLGLSNDWTALNARIDTMAPAGNTNQAIGLQLGWQTLTAAPYTVPAIDLDYKYQTVIILLTDGLNTQDRWYSNASSINTRQQKTCDNIKAAGLTLYTVQVNTGSDPTSTLLQNCASRLGQVLPADHSRTDRHDLWPDRYFALQASLGDVTCRRGVMAAITPRRSFHRLFPPSSQPRVNDGSEECRAFAQSLTIGVYHSSH